MNNDETRSPIPAITDEEVRRHVVRFSRDIADIKVAIMGDEYGNTGLIPRVASVEKQLDQHDRKLLVWGSILSAAGTVMVFLKDFVQSNKS